MNRDIPNPAQTDVPTLLTILMTCHIASRPIRSSSIKYRYGHLEIRLS